MKLFICTAITAMAFGFSTARANATVQDFSIVVDGTSADGIFVSPSMKPRHLILVAHGYTHTTDSWRAHLETLSSQTGALVAAMNYPTTFEGVARGAVETIAAARYFNAEYPSIEVTYLFSVSMGNIVAAIALAETDVFQWWIDVQGVSNLYETWAGATALQHKAAPDIERECGGSPVTGGPAVIDAYTRRSAALRVDEMKAHGLRGAIVVHAPADGLVPYDHSRELVAGLVRVGVPVDFTTVVGRDCRLNHQGNTTIPGYAGQNPACLAGHASEKLADHIIMRTAFAATVELVTGRRTISGTTERIIDQPAP